MTGFAEIKHVRTVQERPFDVVLRWNSEPFASVVDKGKDLSPSSLSPPFAGSRAYYFFRLGLASSFLAELRVDFPYAFLLANDETVDAVPTVERKGIPWSFTWDTDSVSGEGRSVLMDLDRRDLGHFMDGLLGLYPYPATFVLLLSRNKQNADEVALRLMRLSPGNNLKQAVLEVFDVMWLSGEAEYLSIATRDPLLTKRLGFEEQGGGDPVVKGKGRAHEDAA